METHYVRNSPDIMLDGTSVQDTTHYRRVVITDNPISNGMIAVTVWDTGDIKAIIPSMDFDALYSAVPADEDIHNTVPDPINTSLPAIQSPDGTVWSLGVTNAGASEWTAVEA